MLASEFGYDLPDSSIAQTPVEPRHAARLLDTSDMSDHRFLDLPGLLHPGDLVVVNDTRVRAARLVGRKQPTGGKVEALLLSPGADGVWSALVRPARRLPAGTSIQFGEMAGEVVSDPIDGLTAIRLSGTDDIEQAISAHGRVPLPPYITSELADPERYQTVYASTPGSAAAPTAGLHFTPTVLEGLEQRGIGLARVELRVGLDTFRPMMADHVEDHEMHAEWVAIPPSTAQAIADTRQRGGSVVAIGTTVVRTLEARADGSGGVAPGEGDTDLFVTPGFSFTVVDRLVTNFHLPRSTLIVMVAAFMGERWRAAYQTARHRHYRFLSFGDAMLAERAP